MERRASTSSPTARCAGSTATSTPTTPSSRASSPCPCGARPGPWGYDQQTRYEAVGRIETPPGGLGIVKEFEYLKAHTTRRTKATCAGPLTFGSRIHPGQDVQGRGRRGRALRRGDQRGAQGPGRRRAPTSSSSTSRRAATSPARRWRGSSTWPRRASRPSSAFTSASATASAARASSGRYAAYFPGALKARADQFVLEFAGRELSELDLWKKYGDGRELGAGVIDVKGFYPETRGGRGRPHPAGCSRCARPRSST